MGFPKLSVYLGTPQDNTDQGTDDAPTVETVTVSLREVLPLLADAAVSRRVWLDDFADDQVTISNDLYEVLMAYEDFRRPAA